MQKQTPVERLSAEKIIDATRLSSDEKSHINKMTDEEVDFIINLRDKYGHAPVDMHHVKPAIFV